MMTSRNGKNKRGVSGFVKKSARLLVLRTKGTSASDAVGCMQGQLRTCCLGEAVLRRFVRRAPVAGR
eukprot:3462582-Pleurochrysis_carterae.AAC.1